MQAKGDGRASIGGLKPEYTKPAMWRAIVDDVAGLLAPYATHILAIGTGNHETAVLRYQAVDLLLELQERLRVLTGITIPIMGYEWWIKINVTYANNSVTGINGYVHHGFGGSAPVTKGIIQYARKLEELEDVDFVVMGHTHTNTIHSVKRRSIVSGKIDRVKEKLVYAIRPPSYQGTGTWATEKGFAAPSFGSVALMYDVKRYFSKRVPQTTEIKCRPELWVE
jgi:hypothetical protein